jgi:hypothetical protein
MAQQNRTNKSGKGAVHLESPNWKDHPIVVAAVAVAGTIGLAVLLVKEVILPTYTASLTNKIASLSAEVFDLRASKKGAEEKLSYLQTQVDELEGKLTQAQYANLFMFGSPYPVGFGQVQVGEPVSKIDTVYPVAFIDKQESGYWTVSDQHKLFNRITYYFDEKLPQKPITHILFFISYPAKVDENFLQNKLVEVLGVPKQWDRKNYFSWNTQAKVDVYKNGQDEFIVMEKGSRPGFWPD